MSHKQMTSRSNNVKVCRLCMSEESLEDIFQYQQLNIWILNFLSITISEGDTISLSICYGCRMRLHEFREYQLHCLQVQDILLHESVSIKQEIIRIDEAGDVPTVGNRGMDAGQSTLDSTLSNQSDQVYCLSHINEKFSGIDLVLEQLSELTPKAENVCEFEEQNAAISFERIEINDYTNKAHLSTENVQTEAEEAQLPQTDAPIVVNLPEFEDSAQSVGIKQRKETKRTSCSICGKSIRVSLMEGHRNKHLGLRPFKCELGCQKLGYHCRQSRNVHYRNIHRMDEKECHICHKKVKNNSYLAVHLKRAHTPKTFECPICNVKHNTLIQLNSHMKAHDQRKSFTCLHCKLSFYSQSGLIKHIKKHHSDNDPPKAKTVVNSTRKKLKSREPCSICGKKITKTHMKDHLKWHEGFKCERGCKNLRFDRREKQRQHYRTVHKSSHNPSHSPKVNDRYDCDICHKVLKSKRSLWTHKKWVHAPKKFKCSDCNASFMIKISLEDHIDAIHQRERNYCCTICNKAFTCKGYLRKHLKIHRNKLPNEEQATPLEDLFEAEEVKIEAGSDDIGDTF